VVVNPYHQSASRRLQARDYRGGQHRASIGTKTIHAETHKFGFVGDRQLVQKQSHE
jgi:hypothetical protein